MKILEFDHENMSPRTRADTIKLYEQIENGEIDEWTIIDHE